MLRVRPPLVAKPAGSAREVPIGSMFNLHSDVAYARCGAGRPLLASLSRSVKLPFVGPILLPARINLCLWFGQFSYTVKTHVTRAQAPQMSTPNSGSYPSLVDMLCASLDMPMCHRTVTPSVLIRLTRRYHRWIRAPLLPPHISCGHDAVARAGVTDRGLFSTKIRPSICMRYTRSVGTSHMSPR